MSPLSSLGIASTAFNFFSALGTGASSKADAGRSDFAASLALRLAEQRTQSFDALFGAMAGKSAVDGLGSSLESLYDGLFGANGAFAAGSANGLSASGRNLSLFDPESAYRMMTDINGREVTYKAQFAELSEMKAAVGDMQRAGAALAAKMADGTAADDDPALAAELQSFVAAYNEWVGRFEDTVRGGGLLAGTQAAEISLYELRQSVENIFNGAMGGVRGMSDLGLSIDPATHRATLDVDRLNTVLANNRDGAVAAVAEFGQNFARSAELLVSENNFIPNRLDNLDRVIDYIADNRSSLQAEFGLGDPARPSALVAKALAAYERMQMI
ncbi:MAG: hypothetical protein H3C26_18260 [Rhodocyclaceae bacterium]|nr:hypothetical protein [Rhodocyclaceae bacterium]